MECKLRDESNYGRLERGLRGEGETRLHQTEFHFACFYTCRHRGLAARSRDCRCSSFALNYLGLHNATDLLLRLARWPLLIVIVIFGLVVLYRYGPSRREPRWQWISVGSAFAAVAWLVSSALLSWYLGSFAHYDATYGSLGAGIGMMMWMWISSIVILFGAQLNSEIEHQTVRDSTVRGDKPLGARGAVMADTVGKAQYP